MAKKMGRKKFYTISNTTIKYPVNSTILYSFLLYYFRVSDVWWGVFITVFSIYWIIAIILKINEVRIDLNDDSKFENYKFYETVKRNLNKQKIHEKETN